MAKLVAFYSRADENYFGSAYRYITIGNTEKAANMIVKLTGAELLKIEQKVPYAADYNTCIAQAKKDKQKNARPELVSIPESLAGYDEIYLGEHVIIGLSQSDLRETKSRIDLVLFSSGGEIKAPISSPI